MGRFPQLKRTKGGRKWIQMVVNDCPELINDAMEAGHVCFHRRLSQQALYRVAYHYIGYNSPASEKYEIGIMACLRNQQL